MLLTVLVKYKCKKEVVVTMETSSFLKFYLLRLHLFALRYET